MKKLEIEIVGIEEYHVEERRSRYRCKMKVDI